MMAAYAPLGAEPSITYQLLVQKNDLVPVNRKITATAGSLEELEGSLQSELGLAQPVGVCLADPATGGWAQCASIEQLPVKARVQLQPLRPRGANSRLVEAVAKGSASGARAATRGWRLVGGSVDRNSAPGAPAATRRPRSAG